MGLQSLGGYGTLGYPKPLSNQDVAAAQQQAYGGGVGNAGYNVYSKSFETVTVDESKETDMTDKCDAIPDISLTRVFKWAVVLLIAMALGRRVWDMFGDRLTAQMQKALGGAANE